MERPQLPRRRSPYWVRQIDSRKLHAIAYALRIEGMGRDLSSRQEWLWGAIISELEYRRRRDLRAGVSCCSCELCIPPFSGD